MATETPASTAVPLSSTPAAGQLIAHDGKTYTTIREGRAFILIPPNTRTSVDPKVGAGVPGKKDQNEKGKEENGDSAALQPQSVFYNPIQQFNRDLSVLAIKAFGEDWIRRKRIKLDQSKGRKRKWGKKRGVEEAKVADDLGQTEKEVKRVKTSDDSAGANESKEAEGAERDAITSKTQIRTSSKDTEVVETNATGQVESGPAIGQNPDQQAQEKQIRFRVLDALSATGLRALRYAKEIPLITAIVANDMSPNAIKSMALNIEHNDVTSKISTNVGDAIGHMYSVAYPPSRSHGPHHVSQRYDVIDLDPYGTAAPFLDAALQALNDGGLLCVTCTDSAVFASIGYSEKTYALYGGMPIKGPHMHEGGLRLIINSVATSAARYGLAIEPLLSLSIDYYVRIFIRVRKSPFEVKFLAGKTMFVYGCDAGCGAWTTQTLARNARQTAKAGNIWFKHTIAQGPTADRLCEHCNSKRHIAGPMWAGPLHNQAFVEKILNDVQEADPEVYGTIPRIEGMLTTALDELSVNESVTRFDPAASTKDETAELIPQAPSEAIDHHPFFINPSALAKVIHCVAPSDAAIKGALRHAGYRAVRSHCQPGSIKTDAPWTVMWEIMREWVRQKSPIKEGVLKKGLAGWNIMKAAREDDQSNVSEGDAEKTGGETPETLTGINKPSSKDVRMEDTKRINVNFDEALGKDAPGRRLVRYQQNPRENWGPMSKAR